MDARRESVLVRPTFRRSLLTVAVCLLGVATQIMLLRVAPAMAEAASESRAQQLLDTMKSEIQRVANQGPTRIKLTLVTEEFPRMSEGAMRDVIEKQREQVRLKFGSAPTYEERLAAVDHNIRSKVGNHVREEAALVVTAKQGKWRLDHSILQRDEEWQVPVGLENNTFVDRFRLDLNRRRIYTWDGEAHRVLFPAEDRLGRNGQIHADERNRGLVDQALRLGRIPANVLDHIGQSELTVEVASETPDAIELRVWRQDTSWKATFTINPRHGHTLVSIEMDTGRGQRSVCHYGGYEQVDGLWLPKNAVEETFLAVDGEERVVKRREWNVDEVSFRADIEDEDAVFSPGMPADSYVVDHRFDPPLRYRTDEGMHFDKAQVAALVQVLDQQGPSASVDEAGESIDSDAKKVTPVSKAPMRDRASRSGIVLLVVLSAGILLLSAGLLLRKAGKRNAQG